MFKVSKFQIMSQHKLTIDIYQDDDGPRMKIIKRYEHGPQKVTPARIVNNVNFGLHLDAESATEASEWYRIAAATAKTIDVMFKTRDDLKREVDVRLVAGTVTITFKPDNGIARGDDNDLRESFSAGTLPNN